MISPRCLALVGESWVIYMKMSSAAVDKKVKVVPRRSACVTPTVASLTASEG